MQETPRKKRFPNRFLMARRMPKKPYVPPAALVETAKRVGDAIAADSVAVPRFEIQQLASNSEKMLDSLARDVRECKNVYLVSVFVRWLQWSGVINIVNLGSETAGKNLEKKLRDLIYECGEMQRGGKIDLKYSASDIAEINQKLDVLVLALAKKISPADVAIQDFGAIQGSPALKLIQGGHCETFGETAAPAAPAAAAAVSP
jgi:hypothetical protein